jgi:xylan 1,4-beta-xylosidase
MPRPWRNLAQGGESHDWRMGKLITPIKALKPQYIRIDHVFSFYDIVSGSPGNVAFNFSKLDGLLDDIQATGAKPYISLSYMPTAISADGSILSKPARWEDWQLTVQKTIEHISGERRMKDVYYEVWNEPDLFGGWKYSGDKNYLTLYSYAVRGANNARNVQPFKIGGPGITALYKNWFDAMAKFTTQNNLRYDFFSWHRYSTDIDQYRTDMFQAKNWLASTPQLDPNLELHITEWGHDSNNNPGYDTNFGAAQTVAGSIEMINVIDRAFVFEIQDGKDPTGREKWGRWGLFTHQDFGSNAKPRYYALRLLDRLGNQRLQLLGKGSWVKATAAKTDDGTIQVVLANYDRAGVNSENVPITFQNITPGSYTVKQEFLGGRKLSKQIATSAAQLRVEVAMGINSVALVELINNAPATPSGTPETPSLVIPPELNITPTTTQSGSIPIATPTVRPTFSSEISPLPMVSPTIDR